MNTGQQCTQYDITMGRQTPQSYGSDGPYSFSRPFEYGRRCVIACLHGLSTSATPRAACKDSSAQDSSDIQPLTTPVTMGSPIQTVHIDWQEVIFKSHYNLDYNDERVLVRRYRCERLLPKCHIILHIEQTRGVMSGALLDIIRDSTNSNYQRL